MSQPVSSHLDCVRRAVAHSDAGMWLSQMSLWCFPNIRPGSGKWLWESGTFIFLTKMLSSNYLVELKVESKSLIIIFFLYWWNSCTFCKWVITCKGCDKKTEHFICSPRGEILLLVSIKVNGLIHSDWRKMQKVMGARQAKLELPRLRSFRMSLKPA